MAKKKTLLVIDDDPAIGELVDVALGEEFEVRKAVNAEEGMKMLKASKPDCVILDITMPGNSGVTLLSDMSRDSDLAAVPVIMCSGVASDTGIKVDEHLLGEYVGKKPQAFIDKPVDPEKLIKTVHDALR